MHILAILDRPGPALQTLRTVDSLMVRLQDCKVTILHPRQETNPDFQSEDEGIETQSEHAEFEKREQNLSGTLRDIAERWMTTLADTGSAQWLQAIGDVRSIVAEQSRKADLVVVGRHMPSDPDRTRKTLMAALFDANAAVLIAPEQAPRTIGVRPVILWEPSRALDAALSAAWKLLLTAEHVTFLIGALPDECMPDPARRLMDAGISVGIDRFRIDDGEGIALRDHALRANADILVMGAYTHPRFFERLFGGVTEDILAHEMLPLLIHH
ncbi:universal stress protein [Gluconacetobacter entanii]|uniref:Universal stress protein n=2 Tax=Acetobacteraceae TaxID=433 RepID=A0AAP9EW54_GLUTH|nr:MULTISPECIES: universal stress protein [Acetobacteraceae]MCW4589261.1 universal stress protein [Gluconacetobacter entanii]MCW4593117.1 universal stress protein [Gluconacetobacter entanii]NPC90337.1 universal stress protein [Gluconacetobacter entanii]QEH97822.1 universal stress protein [Gluconobacter thailandicus]